jgi:hypothetical protein
MGSQVAKDPTIAALGWVAAAIRTGARSLAQ